MTVRPSREPPFPWRPAIVCAAFAFVAAMDMVMLPIATTAIGRSLGSDAGLVPLAVALVSVVAAPLYVTSGRLSDLHGRKRLFSIGLVLYAAGGVIGGLAAGPAMLVIGWSIVRGLGTVLAFPAAALLLAMHYPVPAHRNRAFSIYGLGGLLAALIGPLLMGFMADRLSWRVPILLSAALVAATWLVARGLDESSPVEGEVDKRGTLLAYLSIASIIVGVTLAGRYGWIGARRPFTVGGLTMNPFGLSPAPILLLLGLAAAVVLIEHVQRAEAAGEPALFRMAVFDRRAFRATWLSATVTAMLVGAIPVVVPVFVQSGLGYDALGSGLVMVAFSVGSIATGIASGAFLTRLGPRRMLQLFGTVLACGLALLTVLIGPGMGLAAVALPMVVVGAGAGAVLAQTTNIQLAALSADHQGEGAGLADTGKELGVGLGAALGVAVLFSGAVAAFVDRLAAKLGAGLDGEQRATIILAVEDAAAGEVGPAVGGPDDGLSGPELEELVTSSFTDGFATTGAAMVVVAVIAVLAASLLPVTTTDRSEPDRG